MPDEIDKLISDLGSPEPNVRWAAAVTLGAIGDARAIDALSASLRDMSVHVRVNAAQALGRLGAPAVNALCRGLTDRSNSVSRNAAKGLVTIGTAAVESVCCALRDVNIHVRQLAAIVIGQIGDARATAPLCNALTDRDDYVRLNARNALKLFGDRDAIVRKVLRAELMTEAEKGLTLNSLRKLQYHPVGHRFGTRISDAQLYCERMQTDCDPLVRAAAQEMMRYLSTSMLLRPSKRSDSDLLVSLPRDAGAEQDRDLLRPIDVQPAPE